MSSLKLGSIVLLTFLCGLVSCTETGNKSLPDKISVQLKWEHQAQFAGLYVAEEKGYYSQENLEVQFFEGGPKIDVTKALIDGRADFAVTAPEDLLIRHSQGNTIKAIAAIYRRSAVVFLSHSSSGISRPHDFPGKTVAVGAKFGAVRDFELQFHSMLKKLSIDPDSMRAIPYDSEFRQFINHEIDVTSTYMTGGLIRLRQKGLKPNVIWPGDYGVIFYSDILATTDQLIDKNPDIIVRFLRATLKGWRTAVGNPKAAVAATMKYAKIKDENIQAAMFHALLPLVHTGEDQIGWMKKGDWTEMIQTLHEQGALSKDIPDPESIYAPQFIKAVYE
jgi:NitT/TauT family transport system substrate-binding protein